MTSMQLRLVSLVMAFGIAGCTERVNVCSSDSECTDPAYPFCDVSGEYAESGHVAMSCSITPASCPVERCGCTPGATTCSGEELATCNADGRSVTMEACSLGCATDEQRCQVFDPSNGLTTQLLASANAEDITLPDGARINTTNGSVLDAANHALSLESVVVSQPNGPDIRVFLGHSWKVAGAKISGDKVLALVSVGPIEITGVIDASAHVAQGGPAAVTAGACIGIAGPDGGGGGGNASAGGTLSSGHGTDAAGGAAVTSWTPFGGGCAGGAAMDGTGTLGVGGAGGGAIQLASLTSINVTASALLDVSGGAGNIDGGGGGAAGNVLLEAPIATFAGAVFANGGSGSSCGIAGNDGTANLDAAPSPATCGTHGEIHAGRGGTLATPPTAGFAMGSRAGGGGAAGRMKVVTRDGTFDSGGAVIDALTMTETLNPR